MTLLAHGTLFASHLLASLKSPSTAERQVTEEGDQQSGAIKK